MWIKYVKGPCKDADCCVGGKNRRHLPSVEIRGPVMFEAGGDAMEVDDKAGEKLLKDHPRLFKKSSPPKPEPAATVAKASVRK